MKGIKNTTLGSLWCLGSLDITVEFPTNMLKNTSDCQRNVNSIKIELLLPLWSLTMAKTTDFKILLCTSLKYNI